MTESVIESRADKIIEELRPANLIVGAPWKLAKIEGFDIRLPAGFQWGQSKMEIPLVGIVFDEGFSEYPKTVALYPQTELVTIARKILKEFDPTYSEE